MDSSINKGSKPTLVDEEDDLGLQHNRNNGSAKQSEEITIVIEKAIKGMLERTRFGSTSVGTTNYIDSENVDQEECESAIFGETEHNTCNISKPVIVAHNVQFHSDQTLHGYAVATAEEICLGNEIVEISANDSDSSLRKDYIDNNESSIIDSDALGSEDVSAEEVLDEFENRTHFEHLPTSSFSDGRKSGYDTPYINSSSRDDSIEEYNSPEKSSSIQEYKDENVTSVMPNKKSSIPNVLMKVETDLNLIVYKSNESQLNKRATSDSLKFFYESIAPNLADEDKNNSLDVIEESSRFLPSENNSFDEDRMPVLVNETEVVTMPFAEDKPPPELVPENILVTEQVIGVVRPFNHEQGLNAGKEVKDALGMSLLSNSRKPLNPPTEVITRNRIRSHCLDSVTNVSRSMIKKPDSYRTVILKHDATKKTIPAIVNGISDKFDIMKPEYISNDVNIRQGISSGNHFRVTYNGAKPVSCEDLKEINNINECPLSEHRLPLTIQNYSAKVLEKHKFPGSAYDFTDESCGNVTTKSNSVQSEFITKGSSIGMENRRRKIYGIDEKVRNVKNNTYYNNVQSEIITMNERKKSLRGNSPNNTSTLPSMPILLSPNSEETNNHVPDTNHNKGGTSKKSENHEIVQKQKPTRSTATQLRSFQRLSFKELSQSLKEQKNSRKVEYLVNKPLLTVARENCVAPTKLEVFNDSKSIGVDGFEHHIDNDSNVRITRSSSRKKESLEEISKSLIKDVMNKKQIKNSVVNHVNSPDSISLPLEAMVIGTKEIDNNFKVFDNLLTDLDLDKTTTNPLDESVPSFDPFIKDIQSTPDILEVLPGADILDGGITDKEIIISSTDVGIIKNDILEEKHGPCLEDGTFSSILNFFDKDLSSERNVQMQQNDTIDNTEQLFNKSDFPLTIPKTDNVFEVDKSDFITIQNVNTIETSKNTCNELKESLISVGEELVDNISKSNSDICSSLNNDSSNCDGIKSEEISSLVTFRNKQKVFPLLIPTEQNDYDIKNSLYSEIEKIDQVLDRELASSLGEDNSERSTQENSSESSNNQNSNEKIVVGKSDMKDVNDTDVLNEETKLLDDHTVHGCDLTSSRRKQPFNNEVDKEIDSSNSKVDGSKQQSVLYTSASDSAVDSRMSGEKIQESNDYLEDISDGDFEIDESNEDDKQAQKNNNTIGKHGRNSYKHVSNNVGNSIKNIRMTPPGSSQKCVYKQISYHREAHKLANCSNIRFSKGSISFNVPPHNNPKNRAYDGTNIRKPFVGMRRKNGRKRSRISKRQKNLNKLKALSNSVSSSNVFSTLQQKGKPVSSSGTVKKSDSNNQSVSVSSVSNNLSSTADRDSTAKTRPLPQNKCDFVSVFQQNNNLLPDILDNKKALSSIKNEIVLHLDSETKSSVNCLSENNNGSFKLNTGMKNIAEDCSVVGELPITEKSNYYTENGKTPPKEKSGSLGDEINVPIMSDNTFQPNSTVEFISSDKQNVNKFQVLVEINSSNSCDNPNQQIQMEEPCINHLDLATEKNFSSGQNVETIEKSDGMQDSLEQNTQRVVNLNNSVVEVQRNIGMTLKIAKNDISLKNVLLKDPKLNESNEVMPEIATHQEQFQEVPGKIPDKPNGKDSILTSIVNTENYDKLVCLSNETSETVSSNKLIGFDIVLEKSGVPSVLCSEISNLDESVSVLNLNNENVSNNDKELTKSPQHKKKQESRDKKSGLEDIIKKLTLKSEILINDEEISKRNVECFITDTGSVNSSKKPGVGNEIGKVKYEKSVVTLLGCDSNKIETEIIDDNLDAQLEMEFSCVKYNKTLSSSQESEKTLNSLNERIITNNVKPFPMGDLISNKQSPQASLNDRTNNVTPNSLTDSAEIVGKIKSKDVKLSAMDSTEVQLLCSTEQCIETLPVIQEVVSKVEADISNLGHINGHMTCPNIHHTSADLSENNSKSSDQDINIEEREKLTIALEAMEIANLDPEHISHINPNESASTVFSDSPPLVVMQNSLNNNEPLSQPVEPNSVNSKSTLLAKNLEVSPLTKPSITEDYTSLPNEIICSPQGSEHCEANKVFIETSYSNENSDVNENCDSSLVEAGNESVVDFNQTLKTEKRGNHCPLESVSENKEYTLKSDEELHSYPKTSKGSASFKCNSESVENESKSATITEQVQDRQCIKQSNESYEKEIIQNKTNENLDESKLIPSVALEPCKGQLEECNILIETKNVNIIGSEIDNIYSKTVTYKKADQQISLIPSDIVPVQADSIEEKYIKKSSDQIIEKDQSRLGISDHLKCASLPNSECGDETGKDIISTLPDDSQSLVLEEKSESLSESIANSEFANGNKPVVSQDLNDLILSEVEANQCVQQTNEAHLSNDLEHAKLSKIKENITENLSTENLILSEIIDEKSAILDNSYIDNEKNIGQTTVHADSNDCMPEENINGKKPLKSQPLESLTRIHNKIVFDTVNIKKVDEDDVSSEINIKKPFVQEFQSSNSEVLESVEINLVTYDLQGKIEKPINVSILDTDSAETEITISNFQEVDNNSKSKEITLEHCENMEQDLTTKSTQHAENEEGAVGDSISVTRSEDGQSEKCFQPEGVVYGVDSGTTSKNEIYEDSGMSPDTSKHGADIEIKSSRDAFTSWLLTKSQRIAADDSTNSLMSTVNGKEKFNQSMSIEKFGNEVLEESVIIHEDLNTSSSTVIFANSVGNREAKSSVDSNLIPEVDENTDRNGSMNLLEPAENKLMNHNEENMSWTKTTENSGKSSLNVYVDNLTVPLIKVHDIKPLTELSNSTDISENRSDISSESYGYKENKSENYNRPTKTDCESIYNSSKINERKIKLMPEIKSAGSCFSNPKKTTYIKGIDKTFSDTLKFQDVNSEIIEEPNDGEKPTEYEKDNINSEVNSSLKSSEISIKLDVSQVNINNEKNGNVGSCDRKSIDESNPDVIIDEAGGNLLSSPLKAQDKISGSMYKGNNDEENSNKEKFMKYEEGIESETDFSQAKSSNDDRNGNALSYDRKSTDLSNPVDISDINVASNRMLSDPLKFQDNNSERFEEVNGVKNPIKEKCTECEDETEIDTTVILSLNSSEVGVTQVELNGGKTNEVKYDNKSPDLTISGLIAAYKDEETGQTSCVPLKSPDSRSIVEANNGTKYSNKEEVSTDSMLISSLKSVKHTIQVEIDGEKNTDVINCDRKSRVLSDLSEIIDMEEEVVKISPDPLKSQDLNSESAEESNDIEKSTDYEVGVAIDSEVIKSLKSSKPAAVVCISQVEINDERNRNAFNFNMKSTTVSNPDVIIDDAGCKLPTSSLKSQDKILKSIEIAKDMKNPNEGRVMEYNKEVGIESDVIISVNCAEQSVEVDISRIENNGGRNANMVSCDIKSKVLSKPSKIMNMEDEESKMVIDPLNYQDNLESKEEPNDTENEIKEKHMNSEEDANGDSGIIDDDVETEGGNRGVLLTPEGNDNSDLSKQTVIEGESEALVHKITESTLNPPNSIYDSPLERTKKLPVPFESSGSIDQEKLLKEIYLKTEVVSSNVNVHDSAAIKNRKDKVSLLSSNDVLGTKLTVSINDSDLNEKINENPQEQDPANGKTKITVRDGYQLVNEKSSKIGDVELSQHKSEVNTNTEPIDSIPGFEEMPDSQSVADRIIEEKTSDPIIKNVESSDSCNDIMNNNPKPYLTDTAEEHNAVDTCTNKKESIQANSMPSEHRSSDLKTVQESTTEESNPENYDDPSFEQISGNGEAYIVAESEACDNPIVADDRVVKNSINLDQISCEDTIENCTTNTHENVHFSEQVDNNSSDFICHQSTSVNPRKLVSPLDDKPALDPCLVGMSQKSETKLVFDPCSQATSFSFCELTDHIPPPSSSEPNSSELNYENSPYPYQQNDDCPTTSDHQSVSVSTNVVVTNYFESVESKADIYKKTELNINKTVTNEISESNPSMSHENSLNPIILIQKIKESRSKKKPASKSLQINDELPQISHKSETESSKLSYSKLDYLRSRRLLAKIQPRKKNYEKKENIKCNKTDLIQGKTKSKISCILSDIVHQSECSITRDLTLGQDEVLLRLVNQYTDSPRNQLIPSNQSEVTISERTLPNIVKSNNTTSVKSHKTLDLFKFPGKSKKDEKISNNITFDKSNLSSNKSICNTIETKNSKSVILQELKEKYMLKEIKIVLEKVDVDHMKQTTENNFEINKKRRQMFGCNVSIKRSTTLSDKGEPPKKILHIHSPEQPRKITPIRSSKSSFANSQVAINVNLKKENRNNTCANHVSKYVQTSNSLTDTRIEDILQVAEMNAKLSRLDSFANIRKCMHENNVRRAFIPENIYNTLKKDDLTSIHSNLEIICTKSVERMTRFKRRRRKSSSSSMDDEMENEDNFSGNLSVRLRRRLPRKTRHSKRFKCNVSDMGLDSDKKVIPSRINTIKGQSSRLADPYEEDRKQSRLVLVEERKRHYYRESESEALPKRPNLEGHTISNVCLKEPEIIQPSTAIETILLHKSSYRVMDRANSTKEETPRNEEFAISTYLSGLGGISNGTEEEMRQLLHHIIRNRVDQAQVISESEEEDSDDDFLGFEGDNKCGCRLENNFVPARCPVNCSLSRLRFKWGYLNRAVELFSSRTVEPVTCSTRIIDQNSDMDRTLKLFSDSNDSVQNVTHMNSTVDSCSENSRQSENGRFCNFRCSSEKSRKEQDSRRSGKNLELHHQTSTKPFRDPGICFVSLTARNGTVLKTEEQERFLISQDNFSGHSQLVTAKNVEIIKRRGQTSLIHASSTEPSSSFLDCVEDDKYEEDSISSS